MNDSLYAIERLQPWGWETVSLTTRPMDVLLAVAPRPTEYRIVPALSQTDFVLLSAPRGAE
jgi:hypothetical protein